MKGLGASELTKEEEEEAAEVRKRKSGPRRRLLLPVDTDLGKAHVA